MADDDFTAEDAADALDGIQSVDNVVDEDLEVFDGLPTDLHFYQTASTAYETGREPRTLRAAYDHRENIMYVVFYSGVYYMYADVPPTVWTSFKAADSPGKFLWHNGFDARNGLVYPYQPVDMSTLSAARKASLTANLNQAKIRQEGLKGSKTVKTLYAKGKRYTKPNRGGF